MLPRHSVKQVHSALAQLCGFHIHRKILSRPLTSHQFAPETWGFVSPVLTSRECQVFQPVWQRIFPLQIQAGDIKCHLHTLTDVLLHTSHAPVTSQWRGTSHPSCPQGGAQTRLGHCPQVSPSGLNLEFSVLRIFYGYLILGQELKTSDDQRAKWAANSDSKEP